MKILVVCQYYYPEPFRITDLCEEMAKRGHTITVVTGLPNYPMGHIYDGYRHGKKRDEVIHNVKVHRCFTVGRRNGAFFRMLNYLSYAISSSFYVSKLESDYDAVFVNQLSPVIMASAGIKYAKRHHVKMILYCLDLWPASLVAGGIKEGSVAYRIFHKISGSIYNKADKILITSKMFRQYLITEFGIQDEKIGYLPQYAEKIFSREAIESQRHEINKPPSDIDLVYAGNVGAAQSIETIIMAAKELTDVTDLRWHIVGDGSQLENCRNLVRELGISSVLFHGRKRLDQMPYYYALADAMLVTLSDDPTLSMTLPGKVQTYMAAGNPIIGSIGGETQSVIKEANCGICGEAGDAHVLAENVKQFIKNRKDVYADNSIAYYRQYFTKDMFINRLIEHINALVQ